MSFIEKLVILRVLLKFRNDSVITLIALLKRHGNVELFNPYFYKFILSFVKKKKQTVITCKSNVKAEVIFNTNCSVFSLTYEQQMKRYSINGLLMDLINIKISHIRKVRHISSLKVPSH